MEPIESRSSVCFVSPRALVDSLVLAIFRAAPVNARSLRVTSVPRKRLRHVAYNVLVLHKNLSGKLKHIRDYEGEGYPDADHCRLMVDRLSCSIFMQEQTERTTQQLMHSHNSHNSFHYHEDDGILTTISRVRHAMGHSADRILLLLFLLKGDKEKSTSEDVISLNSTPIRCHNLLNADSFFAATPRHSVPSLFLPAITRLDSLIPIPPLGEMQPSATSDLWLRDASEFPSSSVKDHSAYPELFGAVRPLPDASLSRCSQRANHDLKLSLPPLPQLPALQKVPNQSLDDVCEFYSKCMAGRDVSVQPLEDDPAFFFRAFSDVRANLSPSKLQLCSSFSQNDARQTQISSPVLDQAASIWRDYRVLQKPPIPDCEPCSLSPLMSMPPSQTMASALAWLLPRNTSKIIDEETLHRHCFSALTGVPSPTFTMQHSSFSLAPTSSPIRLQDVSPAALQNALLQFAHAGTAALRINHLAAHASASGTTLSFTVKSLIFFARSQLLDLCQDVLAVASARSLAQGNFVSPKQSLSRPSFGYRVPPDDWADTGMSQSIKSAFDGIMLQSNLQSPSLLQVLADTASLRRHLLLVASFCHCSPDDGIPWSPATAAHRLVGRGLVDYLVHRSLSCVGRDLALVHSFLQAAFQPVLSDIARWVFCGEADDASAGGGVIQLNTLVEEGKWGRRAWDACVFVDIAQMPHMLSWRQLVYMVTVTGKSSRLLSKYAPDHFLAGGVPGSIPSLHFHIDPALQSRNAEYAARMRSLLLQREEKHVSIVAAAASAAAASKRSKIIEIRRRRAKIEDDERQRIAARRLQGSSYLNELLVAANQSKMLKKQQRDTAISDELRRLEQQQLMGQPSPDRLRDLMEKAKAQIVAEVANEFRAKEQVESAFLSATSPVAAAPALDIPQSTAIMAQLVVKGTTLHSVPLSDTVLSSVSSQGAPSVSPEQKSDTTSIAALKARLAALQAARLAASAKSTASLSQSTSPAAPSEAHSSPPWSTSSSTESAVVSCPVQPVQVDGVLFPAHSSDSPHFGESNRPLVLSIDSGLIPPDSRDDGAADSAADQCADLHQPAVVPMHVSTDGCCDASASTVVIEDGELSSSSCSSIIEDASESDDSSCGCLSDGNESDNLADQNVEHADNRADLDSRNAEFGHPRGDVTHCFWEVSNFMGASPCLVDLNSNSAPKVWISYLSEAPTTTDHESEASAGVSEHHAVNVVNVRLGIVQPILAHYETACSAVVSMMKRDWHLDLYSQTLQHFHLMGDGAFGDSFATALFDSMDEIPLSRLLSVQFDQLLAHALKSSQSDSHPLAHKLRLRYASFSGQTDHNEASSDGLDRLQLVLDISDEPAAIVLTKEVMQCYQSVFVLLLRLRRIIRVAARLFWDMPKERGGFRDPQSLVYSKTTRQHSESLRELTLFRHEISHFAHTLQSYLMTQILHISVPELVEQQRGVRDLQQLMSVHTCFIENVMKRCLLNRRSEAVMSIITSILNVTLKCQALIRRGDPASLASALRSRSEFHSHVGFLYLVLTKLVKRGYNMHLEDILLRLDFSEFYSQTIAQPAN